MRLSISTAGLVCAHRRDGSPRLASLLSPGGPLRRRQASTTSPKAKVQMSTATHVEAFDSPASEILEPPRRQTAGDPLVLGLPLIAVGAFALGLQLVGFVNVGSNGSPLAMLIGASGLGLLLSTAWAASLRFTPLSSPWAAGTSLPTTVLGSLAACTHDPKLLYPAPRRSAPRSSDSPGTQMISVGAQCRLSIRAGGCRPEPVGCCIRGVAEGGRWSFCAGSI